MARLFYSLCHTVELRISEDLVNLWLIEVTIHHLSCLNFGAFASDTVEAKHGMTDFSH